MTFGQFFLGLVALCVATIVYRWQKEIDRKAELRREKRAAYGVFVDELSKRTITYRTLSHSISDGPETLLLKMRDSDQRFEAALTKLALVADKDVMLHVESAREALSSFASEATENITDLLASSSDEEISEEALTKCYRIAWENHSHRIDVAANDLRNQMRRSEFEQETEVKLSRIRNRKLPQK